ncbi:T9SS type A sorting domain-containing protein [Draconibacterium sp. IB214405]|uniref:T9SS type A sorting domain-containing protein n=1 Tax=Draconibacterium sp. IB214405 TaxID=3097352 RepID=UPI002A150CEE|nr:T9SS type A sorting domain-containing protein [Draconibacterium sp. IB214405]MDX8341629.1 T9SS type A sorting domain-containing protein [Draconibacterium sp. IB214405]
MNKYYTLLSLLILVVLSSNAQMKSYNESIKIPPPVCYASGEVERARIAPPAEFLLKSGGAAKCDIVVDYIGFTPEAQAAFEYAVTIWESIVESEMPIRMKATWSGSLDANVLGSCGPETFYKNFKDAPFKERYYPVAIAEKIAKQELNGESRYDMVAQFSSKIDWYLGTDLNTPDDQYDLVSVVLHEIGHGLGFTGFFFTDDDIGAYGFYEFGDATSFDLLVGRGAISGQQLVDTSLFENLSADLLSALQSSNLYANSPVATKQNKGNKPRLYAPVVFDDGSSVYHLNDNTYPNGNENSLMTHAVGLAEAIHDPGPITRGIMDDIGWTNIFIRFDQVKDIEVLQPLVFSGWFESDYAVKDGTAKVIYSLDGFESHSDTIDLVEEDGIYSATYVPESESESISYYLTVQDTMDRKRTSPALAPQEFYTINIGEDNEKPVIEHDEIAYFLLRGEQLELVAHVDDNLGIDTVYVRYFINDVEQEAFGINWEYDDRYIGNFPFNLSELKNGDVVKYAIYAVDASSNSNTKRLPRLSFDYFSFEVEEIFDAVNHYSNNFNEETVDFVISDFEIYTATNFADGALHSPHPYPAPNTDNGELEFTTFLKKPIVLKEGGTMVYDEVVLVEPGNLLSDYGDDDFYDYVIVEGSNDYGMNWYPLADGYDSSDESTWRTNYNSGIPDGENDSETVGTDDWFVSRTITLTDNDYFYEGDTILIRFRLYSDPYAAGWGWAIDNLEIQKPVSADQILLSPGEINVYPNPFNDLVTVEISAVEKESQIQIELFNAVGQKIYATEEQGVIGAFSDQINLSEYGSGMFLIKVSQNGEPVLTRKLIKN